ncbi:hypothetical protein GCM10009557_20610 [Virgisporangium ochraceum]|uniref:WD40 repeat domain-containing protein n=1 Tax=Virgisporangium ochraceum TaxID=65505 RepID=A0A8J3ZZY8_9ACTN|nr:hypothetical protein [Virgisporangium ochraceum]GIJ71348.1 hypothetical protein Voc01_062650 [Virgisporangium ochraceum]
MRPVLIAEAAVPTQSPISHVDGVGWVAAHRDEPTVIVMDEVLGSVVRVDVPTAAQRLRVSVSTRHLAVVSLDELVVCDRQGRLIWRRELSIERAGLPCEPNCHLDTRGVLWVYLPTGDHLVAYDAVSGDEIDRVTLDSSVGAAYFWPHPDQRRLGLSVAMGQDTPLNHLTWLEDRRITGRNLPGGFLTGFTSTGDRYLAMPHDDSQISIHDLHTGKAAITRHTADLTGHHPADRPVMEAAALVSDRYVLLAVDTGDEHEEHLLLSTRTLTRTTDLHYGLPMTHNSVATTDGHGRWITSSHRDDTVRLWQVPDPVDAIPGQQQLW